MSLRRYVRCLPLLTLLAGLLLLRSSIAVAQAIPDPEGPVYPLKTVVRMYDSVERITVRRVYWVAGYTERFYDSTGFVLRKLRHIRMPFGPVVKSVVYHHPNGRKVRVIRSWQGLGTNLIKRWADSGQLCYVWRERIFDSNGYGVRKYREDGKWERAHVYGYPQGIR